MPLNSLVNCSADALPQSFPIQGRKKKKKTNPISGIHTDTHGTASVLRDNSLGIDGDRWNILQTG